MARKEYPWFPVYAADLLADGRVQGWTLEERGAWLTLLCFNWNDGSIPAANSSIARLLHIDTTEAGRIMSAIGDRFVPVPGAPDRLCPLGSRRSGTAPPWYPGSAPRLV